MNDQFILADVDDTGARAGNAVVTVDSSAAADNVAKRLYNRVLHADDPVRCRRRAGLATSL